MQIFISTTGWKWDIPYVYVNQLIEKSTSGFNNTINGSLPWLRYNFMDLEYKGSHYSSHQ